MVKENEEKEKNIHKKKRRKKVKTNTKFFCLRLFHSFETIL